MSTGLFDDVLGPQTGTSTGLFDDVLTGSSAEPAAPGWGQVLRDIPGMIASTTRATIAGMQQKALEELQQAGPTDASVAPALDDARARFAAAKAGMATTPGANIWQRGLQTGAVSASQVIPSLAVGLATRNPSLAAAAMYPSTEGLTYGGLRSEGLDPQRARQHAAIQGAVEVGTEWLPFDFLLKNGDGFIKKTVGFLVRELPGESLATLGQGASDYVAKAQSQGAPVTPGLVWEGVRQASAQLPDTWVATVIGGGLQTGPVALAQRNADGDRARFRERISDGAQPTTGLFDDIIGRAQAAYPDPAPVPQLTGPSESVPPPTPDFTVDPYGRAARPGEARPDDRSLPPPQPSGQYQVTPEGVSVPLTQAEAAVLDAQRQERSDLGLGEARRIAWRRAMPAELETPSTPPAPQPAIEQPASRPAIERVKDDQDLRASLATMRGETGWDTIGGRILRDHKTGEVTGRTLWLPRYPWFKDKPAFASVKMIRAVINKSLAGARLGKREQELANWLAEVAADRIEAANYMPAPDELSGTGLKSSLEDAHDVALTTRAAELDPAGFERIAIVFENDDAGFLRAARKLVDDADAAARGVRAAGQAAPLASRPLERDLFAGSDQESESLARRNAVEAEKARRDAARTGDVSVETGNPNDLFSQARHQTDLADSANAGSVRAVFAAARAIAEGAGEATVSGLRPDLVAIGGSPDVVLKWGDTGQFGLAKIGALRGARVVRGVLEAVALGNISRFSPIKKTVVLAQGDMRAVLSLDEHGAQRTWLLTGWEEVRPDDPGQVSTESGTTQRTPTFSRDALGASLVVSRTRDGVDSNSGSSRPGSGTTLFSNPIGAMFRVGQGMARQAHRANERAARLFGAESAPPPARDQRTTDIPSHVEAGGGTYTTAPFGGIDPEAQRLVLDVMAAEEANIAHERGNAGEPITWAQTGSEAQTLLDSSFGRTFNALVNRLPRSTANAKLLEAFARLVNTAGKNVQAAVEQYNRTGSAQDLAHLNAAREQLGVVLAPFMGYRTEAGRALNILRKVQADFADAQAIFDALGDGNESAMRDFARRVKQAGSVADVLEITRASYRPTALDQFREYWINAVLSGPWTHAVNIASNTAFNLLDAAAELGTSLVSSQVSTRAALARFSGLLAGLRLGVANAGRAFATEEPQLNQTAQLESGKRQAIPGRVGRFVRLPGRLLMAEDEFAKAVSYTGTLYRMAMEEAIAQNPRDPYAVFEQILAGYANNRAVKARAKAEADRLTFQTPLGKIGQGVMHLRDESKVGFLVAPFIRTPTNILKQAATYSPAALAMPSVREQLKAGGRDRHVALGRMLIGSAFMGSMFSLVLQGLMTGAGPDDPGERALWMRSGKKPYSLKVGDEWVRYNRFEPIGMLMGISADMAELKTAAGKGQYDKLAVMVWSSIMLNLADKTYLRGLFDAIEAANDPKRYLSQWVSNLAGSTAVPNIVAQGARATDPFVRDARGYVDTLKGRVPGLRQSLPARLDIAGEPLRRRVVEPLAATTERDDPLAQTMLSLGVFKRPPERTISLRGRTLELSSAQYASLAEFVQRLRWEKLTPIVQSEGFGRMAAADPLRAQVVLGRAYDRVGEAAKLMWLQQNPSILNALKAAAPRHREPSNYAEAHP